MNAHISCDLKPQPKGLYILVFSELWDRFSYYGILSMLVLYLINAFDFSDPNAYELFGVFSALAFAVPVVGGFLGDRLIGFRYAVSVGALLIIIGNTLLAIDEEKLLYFSLSLFIIGVSFFKPNNASLVGLFYDVNDYIRRDTGFLIFYIGMNLGALLGPIVYAFFVKQFGWHAGFLVSAVGMSMTFLLFLLKYKIFKENRESSHLKKRPKLLSIWMYVGLFLCILLLTAMLAFCLRNTLFFRHLLTGIALITISGLFYLGSKLNIQERERLIGLSIIIFFSIFFFACALQTGTSLTLFIDREINRYLLGFEIPTMMFMALQPLFIILSAPLVNKFWKWLVKKKCTPPPMVKLGLGILLAGLSFSIFSDAAEVSKQNILPLLLIIVGNFVLGIGELCIYPVVMSSITQFAPKNFCGTIMGVFFFVLACSGYLSATLAKIISAESISSQTQTNTINYSHAFIQLSWMAFIVCIIVFCLNTWVKRKFA